MNKIHAIGIALALVVGLIFISNLAYGDQLGTGGRTNPLTPSSPYQDGSLSFCNDDGTFCFHVELPGQPAQPGCPYWDNSCGPGLPLQVWGKDAQLIVERGRILDRYHDWSGRHYLVKTGWQHWFPHKNRTFECSVNYQRTDYYCEEWIPR